MSRNALWILPDLSMEPLALFSDGTTFGEKTEKRVCHPKSASLKQKLTKWYDSTIMNSHQAKIEFVFLSQLSEGDVFFTVLIGYSRVAPVLLPSSFV